MEKIKNFLKKTIKYVLPVFLIFFIGIAYFIYNPPAFLIGLIRKQAEIQILKATDLYAKVDRISSLRLGLFKQTAVAEGITIHKNNTATSPNFLDSNKLEIKFNVLSYFIFGPEKSTLELNIIKPVVDMKRDKQGKFDIDSPLFRPSEKKEQKPAEIPKILFSLKDGLFKYEDKTFANTLNVNAKIPVVNAELQNSEYVKYNAKLNESKDIIDVKGTLHTRSGQGTVDSKIYIDNFSRWANVFYNSSKGNFVLKNGSMDLNLKGSWDNYKLANLKFNTDMDAKDLIGKFPYYNRPVNMENLKLTMDQNKIDIQNLKINTQGSYLTATSTSVYNGDSTSVKASIRGDKLLLNNIISSLDKKVVPESVLNLGLSGVGKANIDLDGFFPKLNKQLTFFTYPEAFQLKKVKGKVDVSEGTLMGSHFNRLSSKVDLDSRDLKLSDVYLKAYEGTATGNLTIKKIFKGKIGSVDNKNAYYSGSIKADKVSVNKVIDDFKLSVPSQYKPYANLNADIKVAGLLSNPKVAGKIYSPLVSFDPKYSKLRPIKNLYADLGYSRDAILAKTSLNSADFGVTNIDFAMKQLDHINVKVKTNNFQLRTISNFVQSVDIASGVLNGTAVADFSLKQLKNTKNLDLKKISYLINAKSNLDFDNASIVYKNNKRPLSFSGTDGNIYLDMGHGDIASKVYLSSNETGALNGIFNLKDADRLNAKVTTVNFPLKKLEPFVPALYVRSGIATITSNITTRLSAFEQKMSPDQLLAVLLTNTSVKIANTTLSYKSANSKPFSITNAGGLMTINNNGQDVASTISLSSKEYGNDNIDLKVNNLNATNLKFNVSNLSTSMLANYIPKLHSANGKLKLTGSMFTFLKAFGKNITTEQILSLVDTKAYMNVSDADFKYDLAGNKAVKSNNTDAKVFLSLKNNLLASEILLTSDQFGKANALVSIKNMNATNAKIDITNIPTKTLEAFVPNLRVNSGNGSIKSTLSTNLKDFRSNMSLDQMTYLVDTNTNINFKNNNLRYGDPKKKPVIIDNGVVNIKLFMNDGIVRSNYLLGSNQFGNLKGFLNVDKSRVVNGQLTNNRIDLRNINNFLPNGKIKNGIGIFDVSANGNLRDFTDNPGAISVRGFFDVSGLSAEYKTASKTYDADIELFRDTFSYSKGYFNTDLKIRSNDFGTANLTANMNPKYDINGRIYSTSVKLAKINDFVGNKTLSIKDGDTNINVNFKGNLENIFQDSLDFYANGDISMDNLKTVYNDSSTKVKVKNAENITIEEDKKINQNLDLFKLTFNWKSGLLDINQILLKNGNSSINGKGNIDVDKMTKNPDSRFGKISLYSDNFDLKDFPVKDLAGIQNGQIKKLTLESQLSKNIKNLTFNLNTEVQDLNFDNQTKIDNILAAIDLKNSLITIKKLSLNKDENYLNADGTINIANMANPKFNLGLNSRNFPIKSIFALLPESILKKATSKNVSSVDSKDIIKVSYRLPVKNNFVNKTQNINVNNLIDYWEKWSLEPLTEEDKRGTANLPPYWKAIDGELSLNASIKGDMLEPVALVDMMVSNADIYGRKLNEIFLKASYDNGEINLPNFHFIENEGGYLTMSGNISDSGKISLESDGKLNLNWSKNFLGNKTVDIEGDTVIALDVKGSTTNPDINLSVDSERGGVFNNVYFDNLSLIGSYKNKIVNLADARITSGGREAKASGIIPLDESLGSMNVSLGLTGESMGLVNLFTKQIEWLRGQGDAFLNIQGSLREPLINGRLNIDSAEIYVASLNRPLEKINVNIGLSNHFVKIIRADAFLNEGKVSLIGQVGLIGFRPGFLKLKLFADNFRWEQDNINLNGKVGLTINNTIDAPLIGGKVEITRGEYTLAFGSGSSSSSKSGATLRTKKKAKPSVDAQFNDLKVEIPQNTDFWVRSPFFDLRPYGSLTLQKGSVYDPTILGFAEIDKGNLYLINNEFNIVDARADFGGKDFEKDIFPINPRLSVTADTKLINPRTRANVDVEAKITGDLKDIPQNKMQISWTKTGGLTDAEIWTQVIGLNAAQQLLSDTSSGSANSIAQFATPYFNRAIFNPLTSKVADFLNLEEFNVGIASDAISNPGVSVSIAKPIIGGLSIGYQGTIRSANLAQYNFFTRYRFDNGLSVKASVDERNATALQGEYGYSF